eukprot:4666921-Pyramimonas_sp.AAC.1
MTLMVSWSILHGPELFEYLLQHFEQHVASDAKDRGVLLACGAIALLYRANPRRTTSLERWR